MTTTTQGFAKGQAAIRQAARETSTTAGPQPKVQGYEARRRPGAGTNGATLILPPEGHGDAWSGGGA